MERGGIYVRPDAVIDWIEQVSGVDLPEPDCVQNTAPQPSADPITTLINTSGLSFVDPGDPDTDDTHTFAIIEEPESGQVTVDVDGTVVYIPEDDFVGRDSFVIAVTDSHEDTGEATVDVTVMEDDGESVGLAVNNCGCESGVTPGETGLMVVLIGLLGLRRRS